jgi:hypothetical protein
VDCKGVGALNDRGVAIEINNIKLGTCCLKEIFSKK